MSENFHGPNKTLIEWMDESLLAWRVLEKSGLEMETIRQAFTPDNSGIQSQAAQQAIGKLWYAYPEFGPYPFLETLSDFQYNRKFYPDYRDHVNHQLRVFWLGLYLFDRCNVIKESILKETADESAFLRRWHACAIWHDIGYVMENEEAIEPDGDAWKGTLQALNKSLRTPLYHLPQFKKILTADKELYIRKTKKILWMDLETLREIEVHNGLDLLDQIAEFGVKAGLGIFSEPGKSPFRLYYDYAFQYSPESEKRPRFRDHGIAGAMLLLKIRMEFKEYIDNLSKFATDPLLADISSELVSLKDNLAACEKDILYSSAAVALHNIQTGLWKEKHTLRYGLTLSDFRIRLLENSGRYAMQLAFLLGLSDTLQMWDRQKFKAIRIDDIAGIDSQQMSMVSQNGKIHVCFKEDEKYKRPEKESESLFGKMRKNMEEYLDQEAISELLFYRKIESEKINLKDNKEEYILRENINSVYICYCNREADRQFAKRISNKLKKIGIYIYIDSNILPTNDRRFEIPKMIKQSPFFLLLLSKEATKNKEVKEQVIIASAAYERKIITVLVNYPEKGRENLPYPFSKYLGYHQKLHWDREEDTDRIVEHIKQILAVENEAVFSNKDEFHLKEKRRIAHLFSIPGGALDTKSSFYITRKTDEDLIDELEKRSINIICGAHQTGKTSLLMKVHDLIRPSKLIQSVFIDFASFTTEEFESSDKIWRAIACRICRKLEFLKELKWDKDSHESNILSFFKEIVSIQDESSLRICIDNVDRVFDYAVKDDFFCTILSLYNQRLINQNLRHIQWILTISSEVFFTVEDITKFPFNIWCKIDLEPFSMDEINSLSKRYDLNIDKYDLEIIEECFGGHPYFVHLIFYSLVKYSGSNFTSCDINLHGFKEIKKYFDQYLLRYYQHLKKNEKLQNAMKIIISGGKCQDVEVINRLQLAGLLRYNNAGDIEPFCKFFVEYFKRFIN